MQQILWEKCRKILDPFLFAVYLVGVHWYDVLCACISNEFKYWTALMIMTILLLTISVSLVGGHAWTELRFGWDLMGLEEFKGSKALLPLPRRKIFKRFKLWITKSRRTTLWLGSVIIGPPVVTVLLRKNPGWRESLRYIIPGTLLSVGVWVTFYAGVGLLTWEQYIKPFFRHLRLTI